MVTFFMGLLSNLLAGSKEKTFRDFLDLFCLTHPERATNRLKLGDRFSKIESSLLYEIDDPLIS